MVNFLLVVAALTGAGLCLSAFAVGVITGWIRNG